MIAAALPSLSLNRIRLGAAWVGCLATLFSLAALQTTTTTWPEAGVGSGLGVAARSALERTSGAAPGLPAAARGPVSATIGRADRAYWVSGRHAVNRAQGFAVTFSPRGPHVAARSASAELHLAAVGRGSVERAVAPATPRAAANRVVLDRRTVAEWYLNGPFGLEQGFNVRARPTGASGPVTLSLDVRTNLGMHAVGEGVIFSGHGTRWRYGGLSARDAADHPLRTWLAVGRDRIMIRVADHGARYPLHIDPLLQQATLTASDGAMNDVLGATLAMDGDTIVAAAPNKTVGTNPGQGVLYVFVKPATGWADAHETARLTSSDGTALAQVAISGDTIVAGAPGKQIGENQDQGALYVFVKPAGGWRSATQNAILTASDGAAEDVLGSGLAISGDTVVAGAPGRNDRRGAGYVFVRPVSGWRTATQTAILTALGGAPQDSIGLINSVAISGDTVALGGSNHQVGDHADQGLAYVYVKPDAGWVDATQTATLSSTDGGAGDLFGFAVAVSADVVVVGAPHHMVGRRGPGATYVFSEPPFGWAQRATDTETAELTPSDGATDDRFGAQVGISRTTVFAGSFLHQVGPNPAQGAVYFYTRPGFVWSDETENGQLTASNGGAREGFADTLAVSGTLVAAGAPAHTVSQTTAAGAVYLFGTPPTVTIATPARGATFTRGRKVLASYVCAAAPGTVLSTCSGSVAAGSPINTATPGSHSFTVRTVESDGTTATQTTSYTVVIPHTPPPVAPKIRGLRQTQSAWRTPGTGGHGRHRPPVGTTFTFTLDQPASITLGFTRLVSARSIAAGTATAIGRKGTNHIRFRGHLSSGRTLRAGRYALALTATNAAHQHTTVRSLHFTIMK